MKKSLPILLLAIVMVLAVCFAACTPKQDDTTKTLTDIEIVSKPTKLQYKEGETFDKTGLKVNAVYSDGSKADVTDKCTFSPDGALKASTTKVFVVYSEDVNGKPLRKSKAIDVTVTGDPATKVDFLVDLTPTPADLPHNAITTSTADMLFYGFYDSTSMKCESMLELTSTADNSGTFVFVEMVGHSGTNYRLGRIEGTYAIDGDNITLTATKVHNVAKSATDSAANTGKWAKASKQTGTVVRSEGNIVGVNLGKMSGTNTVWGWSKSNASDFVEGSATAHELAADTLYMEQVVDHKLSSAQKSYYVVESVGIDVNSGIEPGSYYEGEQLTIASDLYVLVTYKLPQGSFEGPVKDGVVDRTNYVNRPLSHSFTMELKRGDQTIDINSALAVGDKLALTVDGVTTEIDLEVKAAPTEPVLRNIEIGAPYKTLYKVGDKIDFNGLTVTANYTKGKDAQKVSGYTVEVEGAQAVGDDYILLATPATIVVTYSEGDITVTGRVQISAPLLPWIATLQSDANYNLINYARQKTNGQEAITAVMLSGNTQSGRYVVVALVTKDSWATIEKTNNYYAYTGNYTIDESGNITLAKPDYWYSSYANGKMFYNPELMDADMVAAIEAGVTGVVTIDNGAITAIAFTNYESATAPGFFGFKNKSQTPMNFAAVTDGAIPEDVAKKIPSFFTEQPQAKAVVAIEFTAPTKKDYKTGETLDTTGMQVFAMYNDGTKVDVTSLCTLSINGELTTEDNTVVVTYGNFTASYNIVVVEAQATLDGIEIGGTYKTEYAAGEKFDASGMTVNAVYGNGTKIDVTANAIVVDGDKALVEGATFVVVSYTFGTGDTAVTKTANVTITVSAAKVVSIAVGGEYKTEYVEGATFNANGLVVTATYTDDSTKDVTADAVIDGADKALEVGMTALTVTYEGKTTEIVISVSAIEPWLRAENSTTSHTFVGYVVRKNGSKDSNKHFAWIALEMYADNTFRVTSRFTTSNWTSGNKMFVQLGTYTIDGNNVTFVLTSAPETSGSTAFATEGTFTATLADNGLYFAYSDTNTAAIFGYNSLDNTPVTMQTLTDGKLSWDLLSAIPTAYRSVDSLEVVGTPVTEYTEGDSFDAGEMKVYALYNDGAKYEVTAHVTYDPSTNLTKDVTSITIEFGGKQTTVEGIVVNQAATPVLNGIDVTNPTKTTYRIGEKIDLAGLAVTAKYSAGKENKTLASGEYTVSVQGSEKAIADLYLSANVTLVVAYTEDDVNVTATIELTVSYVEPWVSAVDTTADKVYVGYGIKKDSSTNGQYTWTSIELYKDSETSGTYRVVNRYTKKSWKSTNKYYIMAGKYTINDGKVEFAIPEFIASDDRTTTIFFNNLPKELAEGETGDILNKPSDAYLADRETVLAAGKFVASIGTDGLTFAYTADDPTSTAFMFSLATPAAWTFGEVVNGEIPTAVKDKIPTIA